MNYTSTQPTAFTCHILDELLRINGLLRTEADITNDFLCRDLLALCLFAVTSFSCVRGPLWVGLVWIEICTSPDFEWTSVHCEGTSIHNYVVTIESGEVYFKSWVWIMRENLVLNWTKCIDQNVRTHSYQLPRAFHFHTKKFPWRKSKFSQLVFRVANPGSRFEKRTADWKQ